MGGVAALAMAGAIAVYAQGPMGPGGHHGPWGKDHNPTDMLAQRLGLTDAQKTQIQPILDAAKPQLKAIHDDARAKAKAVMDDVTTKITPFLTPEQQQDLASMQRHDEAHARPEGRHETRILVFRDRWWIDVLIQIAAASAGGPGGGDAFLVGCRAAALTSEGGGGNAVG